MKSCNDVIKVELTDENTLISPMEEIKKRYPNAIALTFISRNDNESELSLEIKEDASPYELFKGFFLEQNGRELSDDENNGDGDDEGFEFDYWSIRILGDNLTEVAQKRAGETYTLTTSIIAVAIWKETTAVPIGITATYSGTILAGNKINPRS